MRAFVAVPVPAAPSLAALVAALGGIPHLRVVDPDHMHLTLSFLGDIMDAKVPDVAAALDRGVAGARAFTLPLHGVGAFPEPRRPRVVWAGARACPPMDSLAENVRGALRDAGFPGDDKPFRAHVTLARPKPEGAGAPLVAFLAAHRNDEFAEVDVREVHLYRSTLGAGRPQYDIIHTARLEG